MDLEYTICAPLSQVPVDYLVASDALRYGVIVIAGSGGGGHLLKRINKRIPKHPKEAPKAPLSDRRDEISLDAHDSQVKSEVNPYSISSQTTIANHNNNSQ